MTTELLMISSHNTRHPSRPNQIAKDKSRRFTRDRCHVERWPGVRVTPVTQFFLWRGTVSHLISSPPPCPPTQNCPGDLSQSCLGNTTLQLPKKMYCLLLLFLCVTLALTANAAYAPDEITYLPGWPTDLSLPSKQYSGYLNFTDPISETEIHLHYWLVLSEQNPATAPTVLWFNGTFLASPTLWPTNLPTN